MIPVDADLRAAVGDLLRLLTLARLDRDALQRGWHWQFKVRMYFDLPEPSPQVGASSD